jgi:hypothetical protein
MTRVYLDTSVYNRPFDDQTQPKVFLETQAVILILQMVEAKLIELVIAVPIQMRYKITWQGVGARQCPLVST